MDTESEDLGATLANAIKAKVHRELRKDIAGEGKLPEGTITILFTDVEGSSELVRDLGEKRAQKLLRRHDGIVREVLKEYGGTEVERAGDSFMLAFTTARMAIACAVELQHRLAAERKKDPETPTVRMGMDTGEVIPEEMGYFGSTVFRAARIADLARGGQIFTSEATRVLAATTTPPIDFADAGPRELKGLGGTHRIFEIADDPDATARDDTRDGLT
jgi:class 3 adenylate cyclase